jgi:hypothetical protein
LCCQGAEITAAGNLKGAAEKSEGPEKLAAEFLPDLQKIAEKGTNFFKALVSRLICGYSEINAVLS